MNRILLLLFLTACGDDSAPADAARPDASTRDAGARDASIRDASSDGGVRDAGSVDAALADAALLDSALADATADAHLAPCTDDMHEEDDTLALAMAEPPIYGVRPVIVGTFVACPGDVDYFHAYSDCCTTAGVDVAFSGGDLGASLVDPAGAMLTYSSDTSTPSLREIRVDKHGGDFFVRIENAGATAVTYDLTVYAMVFVR